MVVGSNFRYYTYYSFKYQHIIQLYSIDIIYHHISPLCHLMKISENIPTYYWSWRYHRCQHHDQPELRPCCRRPVGRKRPKQRWKRSKGRPLRPVLWIYWLSCFFFFLIPVLWIYCVFFQINYPQFFGFVFLLFKPLFFGFYLGGAFIYVLLAMDPFGKDVNPSWRIFFERLSPPASLDLINLEGWLKRWRIWFSLEGWLTRWGRWVV